jgi:hypothetical protein
MCALRVTLSWRQRQELQHQPHMAQQVGQLHDVTCRLALLTVTDGQSCEEVALTLRVNPKTVDQ